MNQLFKKLPFPVKLALIGLVPLIFLIYLSFRLYTENLQKVDLLGNYIERMQQSADITKLIYHLQIERKYSFDYALKKDSHIELRKVRPMTDSLVKSLSRYESSLADFSAYTFLNDLKAIRTAIDSGHANITMVMDYYTNSLFRFNTLNDLPTGSDVYLKSVYKDLVAQKLLSEMVTYLGIMSANIYNALYTREYMIEILMGTRGVYQFYKSYETEFLLKASPTVAQSYRKSKSISTLQPVSDYLDTLFKKFSFDNTFDYAKWRMTSNSAIDELRALQQTLLQNALDSVHNIYNNEKASGRNLLFFLVFALLLVILAVFYTIRTITKMLNELKIAAKKIARGEPVSAFNIPSKDVIGSLAHSVSKIDNNARMLAQTADAIGNGNFNVTVIKRSEQDMLGIAIEKMKNNLQRLISDLKNAQLEIDELNNQALDHQKLITEVTIQAQEKERNELGRELHDNINQILATVKMYLKMAVEKEEKREELIQKGTHNITFAIEEIRKLSKSLVAPSLGDMGLKIALEELIDELNQSNELKVQLIYEKENEKVIDKTMELMLYRVAQEQLTNIRKYAKASNAVVTARIQDHHLFYSVSDDGIGFDTSQKPKGIGLRNINNRVDFYAGKMNIISTPGKGCILEINIPL